MSGEPGGGGLAGGGRQLPMVRGGRAPPGAIGSEGGAGERAWGHALEPDPERIRDGWEHRFAAAGARADEMIALYEELGFEVVADPLGVETLVEGCAACFGGGPEPVRSIYTRRPKEGSAEVGTAHNQEEEEVTERAGETHPTRVLREEHQRILAVADALEALLDAGPAAVDYDRIDKCIRFIRLFADACHHGKEEDLLFPALVDQGLPRERGPIAVMLHEHRLGRELASTMAASIDRARSGDAEAHARLERAGRDYVALIRGHILKEDNVLFNMADQIVVGPACTRLCAAYDGTGGHTFDGCTKAQLEELGREIVAGM